MGCIRNIYILNKFTNENHRINWLTNSVFARNSLTIFFWCEFGCFSHFSLLIRFWAQQMAMAIIPVYLVLKAAYSHPHLSRYAELDHYLFHVKTIFFSSIVRMQENSLFVQSLNLYFISLCLATSINSYANKTSTVSALSDAFSKDPFYKFAVTSLCGVEICAVIYPLLPRLLLPMANGNTMIALKLKWRRCENERETILAVFLFRFSGEILKIWWKVNTRNTKSVYI